MAFYQPSRVKAVVEESHSRELFVDIAGGVSARIVTRPQDYRWSSYGSYLKGKNIAGLKPEMVLEYL